MTSETGTVDVYEYPEHTFVDGVEFRCLASGQEIPHGEADLCAMKAECPRCEQTVTPTYLGEYPV